jgi:arylsulfatase A-like enzyme
LLLPHRPVHVDEECRALADPSKHVGYNLPGHPPDSLWRATLKSYAGQVRCAHRVLAGIIDAIDSTVGRDNAIVIVQGDHGSRIHAYDPHDPDQPLDAYSTSELNADFATLLAVRRPGVPARLRREPAAVQDVIRELARSGFAGPIPVVGRHYVGRTSIAAKDTAEVRSLTVAEMPWARPPD